MSRRLHVLWALTVVTVALCAIDFLSDLLLTDASDQHAWDLAATTTIVMWLAVLFVTLLDGGES